MLETLKDQQHYDKNTFYLMELYNLLYDLTITINKNPFEKINISIDNNLEAVLNSLNQNLPEQYKLFILLKGIKNCINAFNKEYIQKKVSAKAFIFIIRSEKLANYMMEVLHDQNIVYFPWLLTSFEVLETAFSNPHYYLTPKPVREDILRALAGWCYRINFYEEKEVLLEIINYLNKEHYNFEESTNLKVKITNCLISLQEKYKIFEKGLAEKKQDYEEHVRKIYFLNSYN